MGDRTYAMFRLGGHIETVEEIEMLIEALANEHRRSMDSGNYIDDEAKAKAFLRECAEVPKCPACDDDEVNYGTFEYIEDVCCHIPGLGMFAMWENGGGYSAGQKTIMPDGKEYETPGKDYALVSTRELLKARAEDDPVAAIDKLIADAQMAEGSSLPPFTVSPAVAAYLKIFAGKAA